MAQRFLRKPQLKPSVAACHEEGAEVFEEPQCASLTKMVLAAPEDYKHSSSEAAVAAIVPMSSSVPEACEANIIGTILPFAERFDSHENTLGTVSSCCSRLGRSVVRMSGREKIG